MRKSTTGYVLIVTKRASPSRVALAVHVILRQFTKINRLVNHLVCHVKQRFTSVTANTIGTAVQLTCKRGSKFTVLSPGTIRASARLNLKVCSRGVATNTSIHAKGILVLVRAIVVDAHWNFARRADVLEARLAVVSGVAITNELFVTVLILSFDTLATVPVMKKGEKGLASRHRGKSRQNHDSCYERPPVVMIHVLALFLLPCWVEGVADLDTSSTTNACITSVTFTNVSIAVSLVMKVDFPCHWVEGVSCAFARVLGTGRSIQTLQGTFRLVNRDLPLTLYKSSSRKQQEMKQLDHDDD